MSRPDCLPLDANTFDYFQYQTPTLMRDAGFEHVALAAFSHRDPDFTLNPLSTNRQFHQPYTELAVVGTVVVAGTTADSIWVLIPDCMVPPVGSDAVIDLRHVVELSMGAPFDMGKELPHLDLAVALCPNSLDPTLGLGRRDYWEYINPLLDEWRSVNNSKCPECHRVIKVNSLTICVTPPRSHAFQLLLEMPGACMPLVVLVRTKRQGPHREHPPFPRGTWLLVLRVPPRYRP